MFLNAIQSILTKSRISLQKHLKLLFCALTWENLKPVKSEFILSHLWNRTYFPTLGKQYYTYDHSKTMFQVVNSVFFKWIRLIRNSNFFTYSNSVTKISLLEAWSHVHHTLIWVWHIWKRSIGEGALYLRGLFILFFFDATLTDDEPLWEPIEWSLTQSWIMFIFMFAWIGENLISSRYGSYTGRDKRVWFAWYKTFWLVEGWYIISLGATVLFVIIPFYHELTYTLPLVVSWWNWYSRVFIFKFLALYSVALYLAYYIQINIGLCHWRTLLVLVLLVNIILSYLLYAHFFITFFAYFTDPNWYHKTRLIDYIQLSHEPNKWSWGSAKRDHFSYHKSTTVFWFKNDIPFSSALLLLHVMFFLSLFTLYLYWLTLFRRIYTTQEVTFTYTTYCVSSLRQFYYYFIGIYLLVIFSFILQYWRSPVEHIWLVNSNSLWSLISEIILNYHTLISHSCYS